MSKSIRDNAKYLVNSLIENARSYTTNPKYAEWQPGIVNALPHLEEALQKLQDLEIPTAEKDIIDAVRIAVNTPFMQVPLQSTLRR